MFFNFFKKLNNFHHHLKQILIVCLHPNTIISLVLLIFLNFFEDSTDPPNSLQVNHALDLESKFLKLQLPLLNSGGTNVPFNLFFNMRFVEQHPTDSNKSFNYLVNKFWTLSSLGVVSTWLWGSKAKLV